MKIQYLGKTNSRFIESAWYEIEEYISYSRYGDLSPMLGILYLSSGYGITPFEYALRWSNLSMNQWFHLFYGGALLSQLIYGENPLLKKAQLNPGFGGAYLPLPLRRATE